MNSTVAATGTEQFIALCELLEGPPPTILVKDTKAPVHKSTGSGFAPGTLEDAKAALNQSDRGLGLLLGGSYGLIDIECDEVDEHSTAAEDFYRKLTADYHTGTTTEFQSSRGRHRIFRVSPELRTLVGEGVYKHPSGLEIRVGKSDEYSCYTILPGLGVREWIHTDMPALLPTKLAEKIQALRYQEKKEVTESISSYPDSPGTIYEEQVDWLDILPADGFKLHPGEREPGTIDWVRPGKTTPGISATTGNVGDKLYVFSTDAEVNGVFLPQREPINKFAYYAMTRHGGDMSAAAKALRAAGYTRLNYPRDPDKDYGSAGDGFDEIHVNPAIEDEGPAEIEDMATKLQPLESLMFPGFVTEFAKYHAARSYDYDYRGGAAAGLAVLALALGRTWAAADNTRANGMLLFLAPSGWGKSSAIDTADRVVGTAGLGASIKFRSKSWQASEDSLQVTQNQLVMVDEVQDTIGSGRGNPAVAEAQSWAKDMVTKSKSTYRCRESLKADGGAGAVIDQPALMYFSAGLPDAYWANLPEPYLTDGTLGRMFIVESGDTLPEVNNSRREDPFTENDLATFITAIRDVPEKNGAAPGTGATNQGRLQVRMVETTQEATTRERAYKLECRAEVQRCIKAGKPEGPSWNRAHELMMRYALLHAASGWYDNREISTVTNEPLITVTLANIEAAIDLVNNQMELKTYRIENRSSISEELQSDSDTIRNLLSNQKKTVLPWNFLSKNLKMNADRRMAAMFYLYERRVIYTDAIPDPRGTFFGQYGKHVCLWAHKDELIKKTSLNRKARDTNA